MFLRPLKIGPPQEHGPDRRTLKPKNAGLVRLMLRDPSPAKRTELACLGKIIALIAAPRELSAIAFSTDCQHGFEFSRNSSKR
jgi:hypothetical protein